MDVKTFSKSIARRLEKLLKKVNCEFYVIHKPSNSSVASNSNYIDVHYPDGWDGEFSDIKISDHFNRGYTGYNLDIIGLKLNAATAQEWAEKIFDKMKAHKI